MSDLWAFMLVMAVWLFLTLWVIKTVNSAEHKYRPMKKRIYGK